jgi:hypothetical protein
VTVCTHHLTLFHFGQNGRPVSISNAIGDPELLVTEMVELEHEHIAFSAVDARVLSQVANEEPHALLELLSLPEPGE